MFGAIEVGMIASEVLQEGEQAVWWPVAAGAAVRRCDAVQRALFDRQVGVQVDVRRALLLVAEPGFGEQWNEKSR